VVADHRVPLTTLLSQTLVAFTIELDNEFERQMPHRTTSKGRAAEARGAPWLVSLVMWENCMRFVDQAGVTVRELDALARTGTNVDGMRRWGYITVEGTRRADAVLRATRAGLAAREIWAPLPELVESRWRERLAGSAVDELRDALWGVARQLDVRLPDCLPILGHGLYSRGRISPAAARPDERAADLPLHALLSRVLLAYAIAFERESDVSLAIGADVLRTLDDEGVELRDLPQLGGVSKEAIAMALGVLEKREHVVVEQGPAGGRFKLVRLTPAGRAVREAHGRLLGAIEGRSQARFGDETIAALRRSLEGLTLAVASLYEDGWRASRPIPDTLPHFPMVLHRGGFPDGS
jgi:DNA-binding MarR family transcriptional regulator